MASGYRCLIARCCCIKGVSALLLFAMGAKVRKRGQMGVDSFGAKFNVDIGWISWSGAETGVGEGGLLEDFFCFGHFFREKGFFGGNGGFHDHYSWVASFFKRFSDCIFLKDRHMTNLRKSFY